MLAVRSRRTLLYIIAALVSWILATSFPQLSSQLSLLRLLNTDPPPPESCPCSSGPEFEPFDGLPLQKELKRHNYREDGLLEVNPEGAHPIFELIDQAERKWNQKIARASSSLDEAIREYRRRYRRNPPKGFDHWWDYVQLHDVRLPDEYDQIYHDLEAFWGIEPKDLIAIRDENEAKIDSYTIGKTEHSPISVVKTSFQEGRYDQLIAGSVKIVDLLRDVEEFLPPFRATFSPHDGPNRHTDYAVEAATLEAAANGQYIARSALPRITNLGWVAACSPSSPARAQPINLDKAPPPKPKKTFIYDHLTSMNLCLNPHLLWHHGQFLSHNNGPTPQTAMVPEFSACSTTVHHNIRIPTPYGWVEDVPRGDDPEWDQKLDERLLWRGTNTGIYHADHTRWQESHRISAVGHANDLNGTMDIILPQDSKLHPVGEPKTARKSHVNPAMMDIAFAGDPTACTPKTCTLLEQKFPWRERQTFKEAGNYKYVLDIDGNGWSGRFKRLITSNAVVFKSTIYPEWFADRIAPWVHYVPIQVDNSDLHDALMFFRGDANGDGAHEDLARKIAVEGRKWSKEYWRREDLVAYFFRLMLEYSRLMHLDREAMSFHGDGDED